MDGCSTLRPYEYLWQPRVPDILTTQFLFFAWGKKFEILLQQFIVSEHPDAVRTAGSGVQMNIWICTAHFPLNNKRNTQENDTCAKTAVKKASHNSNVDPGNNLRYTKDVGTLFWKVSIMLKCPVFLFKRLIIDRVSDFWKPILILEITNTNTPLLQKGFAPVLIALPHTYIAYATHPTISSVKQSKTNVTLCIHRMRAAQKNTLEVIIFSDAVYTGCCAAQQNTDIKLLSRSIYDVLTQISNNFQQSFYHVQCRQTLAVAARRVRCRHGVTHLSRRTKQPLCPITGLLLLEFSPALESWSDIYTGSTSCFIFPQTFSSCVFLPASLSVTRMFTERSLLHITSRHFPYCWLATSLFWSSAPTQNDIPHL